MRVCVCVAKPAEGLIKRKNVTIFAISKVRIIDASKTSIYASDITTACETVEFMTVNLRKMFVNFTSNKPVEKSRFKHYPVFHQSVFQN